MHEEVDRSIYHNQEILILLQAHEKDAQEKIWNLENRRLIAIARYWLSSPEEAQFLVADIFCDFFFKYIDNIKDSQCISAYLRIMTVRRARRYNHRCASQQPIEPNDAVDHSHLTASEEVDQSVWRRWLENCQQKLSKKAREILRLHYGHELSYAAIGEIKGISKQAIGNIVQKSLDALRRCLEKTRIDATIERRYRGARSD